MEIVYFIERSCVSLTVIGQYHEICQEPCMGHISNPNQTKEIQNYIYANISYYISKLFFLMAILCCFTPGLHNSNAKMENVYLN